MTPALTQAMVDGMDDTAGLMAKSVGQQLTLEANAAWTKRAAVELRSWLNSRKAAGATHMTMEEFRHVAQQQPESHKAWGALTTVAKNMGLIAHDGYVRAQSVKTHAHPIGLWRIV
ncbi:hypothetical protein EJP67_18495 [Variovorax guangxiensis]|uniref:Uncharacterized protein n=1 Tax=Variovorax guangxiensis TaxID=1775474 RepID=A0A433MLS9_9BURK|nr:hypothetical protein [Variovorax guangxiensis]RUR69051.1 hypothetical protein EJP67_18495 [Variovorax guangxiensis]